MRRKRSPDQLYKRAQVNSYQYGAHHDEDSKMLDTTCVSRIIRDQNYVLDRYEMYVLRLSDLGNAG